MVKKGGSIASDNVVKLISSDAFKMLNKHFTNLVGGSKPPKPLRRIKEIEQTGKHYTISNCKKGGDLLYSVYNSGPVVNRNIINRTASNDKFLSQQSISTLPTLSKKTNYGSPVDSEMSFSYAPKAIDFTGGKYKKNKSKTKPKKKEKK
jgi:hypothetical protein